jgi:hypothetical protein
MDVESVDGESWEIVGDFRLNFGSTFTKISSLITC